ncbi:MAG: cyanophycinase [Acidobacteriaceae bacterium]|nr:cyanophycinase [Acidobacteriaceae bacterium]
MVLTIASEQPREQWEEYRKTFTDLGLQNIEQVDARSRQELIQNVSPESLDENTVVFFAGGDQMKITSRFGGTPLCDRMRELYTGGALIAGTSSGASVMAEVMMAAGESESSPRLEESIRLAPGLGFISGVIIDQHFAERGRMGRLLGAVAQNPRLLGIGIDEDTALVFQGHREAAVMGSGAVYIIDGRRVTHTNAGQDGNKVISMFDITLHLLGSGDRFDLTNRCPQTGRTEDIESQLVEAR